MTQTPPPLRRAPRLRRWHAAVVIAIGTMPWALALPRDLPEGLDRRLYVANDAERRIDVFDVNRSHTLHHSITPRLNGRNLLDTRCRGIAAHAGTRRLYFTDSDQSNVVALDLVTERVLWERRLDKSECHHPDRLSVTVDGRALYVPCKLSDSIAGARRERRLDDHGAQGQHRRGATQHLCRRAWRVHVSRLLPEPHLPRV